MSPAQIATLAKSAPDIFDGESERSMQRRAEAGLELLGYMKRDHVGIAWNHNRKWQIHLHVCEGNPILLDILLLDGENGRYREDELKTGTGRLTKTQSLLVARGNGRVWRDVGQYLDDVERWEDGNEGGTE